MYNPLHVASALTIGAILCLSSTAAFADDGIGEKHVGEDHNQIDGVRFDVHGNFNSYGALGAGIRADIPIVANGFINGVNDELAISPGVEVFFFNTWNDFGGRPYVMPLAMLQWNFYIGDEWSVFPELGVALFVGDEDYLPGGNAIYATVASGVGARYHFSTRNALLLRASWPAGLQFGVTF